MSPTTFALLTLAHFALVLLMPIVMVGVVNRTKSWWAGRKGPRILQSASDLRRLLRKRPIISNVASPLFRAGAYIVLVCGLLAASMAPLLGQFAPLQFSHDFIVVAYTLGLARIALMISAMEVGSAFEGMGAAREASFSTYAEPALFLLMGSLGAATGMSSFADLIGHLHSTPYYLLMVLPLTVALLILLQTEAARVPVDDPLTHLELTMIHEAMILEYSGRHLALIEWASMMKLFIFSSLGIALFCPWGIAATGEPAAMVLGLLLLAGKLAALGVILVLIETGLAKMRLFRLTEYLGGAFLLATLGMLSFFILE